MAWAVVQADPYDSDIWQLVPYFLIPAALMGYIIFGVIGAGIGTIVGLVRSSTAKEHNGDEPPIAAP
jgi:hypothetical protein